MKKQLFLILALCATTLAWGTTVTKTAKEIADGKWTAKAAYASATLDDVITITVTPGDGENKNGTYYTSDYTDTHDWRMYQARANGQFTISAAQGYVITSVTLTYEVTNTGVVSTAVKESGVATPAAKQILSGTPYSFAAHELTFYVGNTTAATTNGQARIRSFSVTYGKTVVEEFKAPDGTTDWNFGTEATSVEGKYYTWTLTQCRHNSNNLDATKTHGAGVGMWKKNSSSFVTTAEGGVKAIAFYWNQMNANESNKTDKMVVSLNGITQSSQSITGTTADNRGEDVLCILTPTTASAPASWPKNNCELKITPDGAAEARVTFGPLTVVPYIFYTQKSATLNVTEANPTTTFTNTQLIDNRDDATAIVYSIVGENDGVATINAETGEVTGLKPGTVTVQAAYGEAKTTYQLTITGDGQIDPELTFEKETVWCKLGDSFTNTLTHKGDGTVTYTSNRTERATIDASGKVTTIFYGQVIITASIEASGFYKAAEKTYVVNIQPTETPIYELFSTVTQETALASATWNGDTGEKWTAVYARRKSTADEINGHLATRLGATASIVSNTRLQGGVKYISFIVRQQNADDVTADNYGVLIQRINSAGTAKTNNRFSFGANANLPVAYVVDTLGSSKPSIYADAYKLYFGNESKKDGKVVTASGAAPILIDSIAFYPYIYFMKDRTVSMKDQGSYDNMKCNVAEAEYLLNNITAADGGSVSYSIVGENYGASINATTGEVDYSEVTEDADIKIQAKYYEAITSQILHVNALKAPVITVTGVTSGSMAKTFKDGSFKLSYTLKVGGETRTDIPLTWTSSDPSIASIDNDGNITIYMAGSVTITASNEEDIAGNLRASSYSFTLDIAGIGENESLIERFTDITASAWTHNETSFKSTAYGTDWKVNHFTTKYNDEVLGEKAVRLSKDATTLGEINSDGAIEGGIKAVAFDWWLAGSEDQNVQFGVTAGSVAKTIKYDAIPSGSSNTTHYEQFFGVKSNCNFQFLMNDYTQNSFILGPVTITPYIYYKQREVLLDLKAAAAPIDSKTVLINNTDNEGTISFASANTSVATVDATTGVITAAEGGETDVTATWSKGATTKIHVVAAEVYNRIWDLIDAQPDGTTAPVIVTFLQDIILDIDKTNKTVKILGMDGNPETYVYVHADASVPATWKAEEGSISNKVFGYWSKNVDGSYTLTITSWDKLLYLENGEIPPVPGMQKPTVTTLNNGEDLTIGLDAAPVTLPLSVTYEKVAGTYMPVTNPSCEFTSSNENIVTIDENGQVTVVGVGTAVLTAHFVATNDYEESEGTINVTVEVPEEVNNGWIEGFSNFKADGYTGYTPNIAGDYGIVWTARNFRHKTNDDNVDGKCGVRLKYNASSDGKEAYFETNSLEGGVKRLLFKWKTPENSENPKFTVEFDNKATIYTVDQEQTKEHSGTEYDFGYNANIAKNAKFTIRVTDGTCPSIFGPLTVVPYLFFTQKTAEVNALEQNSYTYPADKLINNTEDGTVTYSITSNSGATINAATGEVNLTTVTSAATETITATWGEVTTTYSLKINYTAPAEGTYWKETFNSLGNKDTYQGYTTDIAGDYGVTWIARNFRHKTSDETDMVDDEYGVCLNAKATDDRDAYIETSSLEGGVKRLQFKWRTPTNSENPKFTVEFDSKATVYTVDQEQAAADAGTVYDFGYNANIAKNAKFTIRVSKETTCASIFGPLTVVPYLFYTEKVVEKTFVVDGTNTVDAFDNLINNLEAGETVTYSLSAGAQATIDGSTITLANATEDITVTATWGEVSTTFTLKVTKADDPVVEPDFVLESKTAGAYATICLPNKIDRVENATLWSINYGNTQEIEFVEADFENDKAGMPYLVQVAADGNVNFYYGDGDAVDAPVSAEEAKGFVGSLQEDPQEIPSDGSAILVSGGQLHIAGEWCVLIKNHAYIDSNNLPASAPVGGAPRRTIRLYNPDAAPTNLNGLNGAVKPMKVLRDGQFYIIRDTKTYNAQGILVE